MSNGIILAIAVILKADSINPLERVKMQDMRSIAAFFTEGESLQEPAFLPKTVPWQNHIVTSAVAYALNTSQVFIEMHMPAVYNLLYKESLIPYEQSKTK